MREMARVIGSFGTIVILFFSSPWAVAATSAVVTLDTPKAINFGSLSATITILDPVTGTFGTATAQPGLLKAEIIGKSGAVATALATFSDSLTLLGPGATGRIKITEVLDGTLDVGVAGGQAKVLAAVSITGAGISGAQAQYEKTQQFMLPAVETGPLEVIVDVPIGSTVDVLTQLNANAIGIAASPSTSDYHATDQIFITSLTPGVTISALSGHNYALVPEPSSVAELALGLLTLAPFIWRLRGSRERGRPALRSSADRKSERRGLNLQAS